MSLRPYRSRIPARGEQFSSLEEDRANEQAGREQGRVNKFVHNLTKQAAKGDQRAVATLMRVQSGELDLSAAGKSNITSDADRRKNIETKKTLAGRKVEALYGDQGGLPKPGQAMPQNPGSTEARSALGNGSGSSPENAAKSGTNGQWANIGDSPASTTSPEPSATVGDTTPAAAPGASKNGKPEASFESRRGVGKNGRPETDFEMMDREARERIGEEGGWGKAKPNFAKDAQDAFKSDLEKSDLINKGRAFQGDLAGPEAEAVKAAQEMALKRGESLGGNREQLQAMIGMETDAQAIERKAGEKSMSEKEASNQRIAKIEAGLKKTGDKAASDYLSNNRDSFESLDVSISKAQEIRDGIGKDEMGKALYSASDREALVINEAEQKDKLALMREKQIAGSRDLETSGLAAEEINLARKEIRDNPISGFSGRNEGDWINDESQGIMPDQKFLRENADNPQAIKDKVRINIGNRQAIDSAFNSELGGKTGKTIVSLTAEEKANSKNPFQTGKEVGFETDGFGNVKRQALDSTARYSERLESIDKILTAASKTGYPVWQDKELMADANFKKKVMANPVLKQKFEQAEQSKKTLQVVGNAKAVVQKIKDQNTWYKG